MAVGISQKKNVDDTVRRFLPRNCSIILFHYDGNTEGWCDLEWNDKALHIVARNQTKWLHTVLAVDAYSDKIKHLLDATEGQECSAALGLVRSSSTASISSTTPGSRVSSRRRIWLVPFIFSLVVITINLAAICIPADYHTRPLDTIFSNFIDALPVVSFETPELVHFQLDFFLYSSLNKKERKKVCEVDILKKDPEAIREQIEKLERMRNPQEGRTIGTLPLGVVGLLLLLHKTTIERSDLPLESQTPTSTSTLPDQPSGAPPPPYKFPRPGLNKTRQIGLETDLPVRSSAL
ncbi:hypothetical protein ZIOFF_062621 [Zingiber officinale]|uniref:Uncharacterized protein n=1 Tax=Zingiber officinale TaxID=94328 RepID=A0A8J5F276_ZINOF|nr:hypothetical protein ZIOFF_062621 [Zingiber officinale]